MPLKRSRLLRKTPLKRSGWLRRTKPKPTPVSERQAKLDFEAACYGKPCAMCGRTGYVDSHHIVPKQRLKRPGGVFGVPAGKPLPTLAEILWDPRNAMPLDRACHDAHHNRSRPVPRHLIPQAAWEFAQELGLTHVLERSYPIEKEAA